MTNGASPTSPDAVLAAGSLVDVPVTPGQAQAVSDRVALYGTPQAPHAHLDAWLIPPPDACLASAVPDELEVHYRYISEASFDLSCPPLQLQVIVYAPDGVALSEQDYGPVLDA